MDFVRIAPEWSVEIAPWTDPTSVACDKAVSCSNMMCLCYLEKCLLLPVSMFP